MLADGGKKVIARMYFAKSKQCSMLNTVCSHISNLFEGVTKKFEYKMRLVYAHFPINVNIINGGKTIEIRNFLGEKVVRTVHMLPGIAVEKSSNTKDEIIVSGTDIELAGRSTALIHQSCLCKKKDIRKFLDGIYVSSHGVHEESEVDEIRHSGRRHISRNAMARAALSVEAEATTSREAAAVYGGARGGEKPQRLEEEVKGAFIIFGLGSWSSINAAFRFSEALRLKRMKRNGNGTLADIFVQSSFLVAELPEKWALSTWRYTTALAIGEGLSGSCAGVLGMLQSFNVLPKSFAAAFAFSLALCLCALLALLFIDRHHAAAKLRSDGAGSDGALMETPADVPSDLMGQLLHFRAGMLALFWGSALNFGLLPSLNPIACSGFSNAQEVLLWSNAVIYGFDPISRLLTACTNFRHFWSLTALFTFAALLVVAVAKTKSLLGEWVVPAANVAFAAGFGYARTMAFLVLKDLDSLAPRLYAAAGAAVQAGSFFGTVVALLLVEVLKVF
ncbi:unnamed protein product [Effrenium voratum]|nr:unnamed protein product [Effrenium voratum]